MEEIGGVDFNLLRNFGVAIFALLNPIGKVPLWAELTGDLDASARRRMAWMIGATGTGVLLAFLVGGKYILSLFSIGLPAFQAAGGILVLITAIDMVKGRSTSLDEREEDGESPGEVAKQRFRKTVVPLAVPMIAGPGSITVVIMFGSRTDTIMNVVVMALMLLVVLAVVVLVLRLSHHFEEHVDPTLFTVVTRIFGLMLAGIAIQLLFEALGQAFPALETTSSTFR